MRNGKLLLVISLMVVLSILTTSVAVSYAFQIREGRLAGWNKLTKEQKTILVQKIQEMKKNGATPQEIKTAIIALLREWGFKVPQNMGLWMLKLRILLRRYYLHHRR